MAVGFPAILCGVGILGIFFFCLLTSSFNLGLSVKGSRGAGSSLAMDGYSPVSGITRWGRDR